MMFLLYKRFSSRRNMREINLCDFAVQSSRSVTNLVSKYL